MLRVNFTANLLLIKKLIFQQNSERWHYLSSRWWSWNLRPVSHLHLHQILLVHLLNHLSSTVIILNWCLSRQNHGHQLPQNLYFSFFHPTNSWPKLFSSLFPSEFFSANPVNFDDLCHMLYSTSALLALDKTQLLSAGTLGTLQRQLYHLIYLCNSQAVLHLYS